MNPQRFNPSLARLLCLCALVVLAAGCLSAAPFPTSTAVPAALPAKTPLATLASQPAPAGISAVAAPDYWPTNGWRTSTPEQQGMDAQKLAQMLDDIKRQGLNLHSLLIIRNGYIVGETYFGSYGQNTTHELYSCTKSFISTLVGIALDKGYIDRLDGPVQVFFPSRTWQNSDARKQAMTLENLLTMTSGLAWEEGDPVYRQMYMSRDWVQYVMDIPMREQPGSTFNYCSGCSHVLSSIVQNKTGMNTRDFAQKVLFGPLGISNYDWQTDAQGIPIGGWGLQLTPRDMAKLGFLYLHQGTWEGKQVVSANWVQTATSKHTGTDGNLGYGYQWWTYPTFGAYTALGRYGQTIFVIPNLNLIVVTTAAEETGHDKIFPLIDKYIVPAAQKS